MLPAISLGKVIFFCRESGNPIINTVVSCRGFVSGGWWRGSVVRTLVFGWRTFSDVCLIYGLHVTTLWVKCLSALGQLTRPTQPSIPLGR